jgi:hypothetical protein
LRNWLSGHHNRLLIERFNNNKSPVHAFLNANHFIADSEYAQDNCANKKFGGKAELDKKIKGAAGKRPSNLLNQTPYRIFFKNLLICFEIN